jgi:hypothetical protein
MDIKSPDARNRNIRIIIIWECTVRKMQKNQKYKYGCKLLNDKEYVVER